MQFARVQSTVVRGRLLEISCSTGVPDEYITKSRTNLALLIPTRSMSWCQPINTSDEVCVEVVKCRALTWIVSDFIQYTRMNIILERGHTGSTLV